MMFSKLVDRNKDLALVLKTGALPIELEMSQVEHVSATNLAMAAYTAAACGGPFTLLSCNADLANPTLLNTEPPLKRSITWYIPSWMRSLILQNPT